MKKPQTRRKFLQQYIAAGTAASAGFYLSLLKATETFANSGELQKSNQDQSLFLTNVRDQLDPLDRKALWAGPLMKGGGDGDKYGGPMEEPNAKKK